MTDVTEFRRRSRIFRIVYFAVGTLMLGAVLLGQFSVISRSLQLAVAGPATAIGLAWMWWGLRWARAAQPMTAVSAAQEAAIQAARTQVVRKYGLAWFGLSWGVLMALWMTWTDLPDHQWRSIWTAATAARVALHLVLWIPAGLLAGYLWGRFMWSMYAPKTSSDTDRPAT